MIAEPLDKFQQSISAKFVEIEHKQALLKAQLVQRSSTSPEVGDIFMFKAPKILGIQWVVLDDDNSSARFLIVPADDTPMVGSTDVELSPSALCSPLTLRCAYKLWLTYENFDLNLRIGMLEERHQQRALDKLTQIDENKIRSSVLQQEMDDDLEYEEWTVEISQAREALQDIFQKEKIKKAEQNKLKIMKIFKVLFYLYQKLVTFLSPVQMAPIAVLIGMILGGIVTYPLQPISQGENPFGESELDLSQPIVTKGNNSPITFTDQPPLVELSEDWTQLPPEEWLNKSLEKIRDGDIQTAIKLLQQFQVKYPNYHPDNE